LPPPHTINIGKAHQEFCKRLLFAAKDCIPRGRRTTGTTCNVVTKNTRYFISPSSEPQRALTLVEPFCPYFLGSNRRSRSNVKKLLIPSTSCAQAVSRVAPPIQHLLARTFCLCPVSQFVKNEAHKTESRKSTRLVNKPLSNLWKVPTTQGNSIAGPFRPEESTVAPRCLKPR